MSFDSERGYKNSSIVKNGFAVVSKVLACDFSHTLISYERAWHVSSSKRWGLGAFRIPIVVSFGLGARHLNKCFLCLGSHFHATHSSSSSSRIG